MGGGINLNTDAEGVSHLADAKDGTGKNRETNHRPAKREGRGASYAVGDEGLGFQAESSTKPYGGLRIPRSRGLNLPPTDPGD